MIREELDENNFRHYYGIFFGSTISKLLDQNNVQSSFATITRHLDNDIWTDILQLKICRHGSLTNFFFSKYI